MILANPASVSPETPASSFWVPQMETKSARFPACLRSLIDSHQDLSKSLDINAHVGIRFQLEGLV